MSRTLMGYGKSKSSESIEHKLRWLFPLLMSAGFASSIRAERIVLAPDANTLDPKSYKTSFLIRPDSGNSNISWLTVSTAQSIEIEVQRQHNMGDKRALTGLNVEYPFLSELGAVPAVSVGVRDLLGTGSEHHSLYLAVARTIPLSNSQAKIVRSLKLDAGVGTERINGLFGGIQIVFRSGMDVQLEGLRKRFNFGIGLPVAHNVQVRASGLNGVIFYGLTFSTAH